MTSERMAGTQDSEWASSEEPLTINVGGEQASGNERVHDYYMYLFGWVSHKCIIQTMM